MGLSERVYPGRDNTLDYLLKADGTAVNLSGVTKMELVFPAFTVSSENNPDVFDWSEGDGKLILALGGSLKNKDGDAVDLPEKNSNASLIVYDNDNTNGINWGKITIYV